MNRMRVVLGLLLFGLSGLQVWTQYQAAQYGSHPALGLPLWQTRAFAHTYTLYAPWKGLVWWWQWREITDFRFALLLVIMAFGVAASVAAWQMRCGTRRQPPPMTGHGSARWGTTQDARQAGLYGKDGIVLGKFGRRFF